MGRGANLFYCPALLGLADEIERIEQVVAPRFPQSATPALSIILRAGTHMPDMRACIASLGRAVTAAHCEAELIVICDPRQAEPWAEGIESVCIEPQMAESEALGRAIDIARGDRLLLMNGPHMPLETSIANALAAWAATTKLGTVGGRVVSRNAEVLAAGGDALADTPPGRKRRRRLAEHPSLMFARNTTFTTGQFLMTERASIIEQVGWNASAGSWDDATFDLCARLSRAGLQHLYLPSCVIVDGSANASIQPGGPPLGAAPKSPQPMPRILLFDDMVPHDSMGSGFPRARQILECLATLDVQVTFQPKLGDQESWDSVRKVVPDAIAVQYPGVENLRESLENRSNDYDAIWVSRPHNMELVVESLARLPADCARPYIIYDAEALYADREIAKQALRGSPLPPDEAESLRSAEIALINNADHAFAVSDADRDVLARHGRTPVSTLGHFLTPRTDTPGFDERHGILFMGSLHAEGTPNVDSLHWFCAHILPHIRKSLGADVRLQVVGMNKVESIAALDGKDIDLLGTIDDPAPIFDAARLFVAPTRFCAGIPLKIHYAASYGTPVVGTQLLARQLGWEPGSALFATDEPEQFAKHVIALHEDAALWNAMRSEAQRRILSDCSKPRFFEAVEAVIANLPVRLPVRATHAA